MLTRHAYGGANHYGVCFVQEASHAIPAAMPRGPAIAPPAAAPAIVAAAVAPLFLAMCSNRKGSLVLCPVLDSASCGLCNVPIIAESWHWTAHHGICCKQPSFSTDRLGLQSLQVLWQTGPDSCNGCRSRLISCVPHR